MLVAFEIAPQRIGDDGVEVDLPAPCSISPRTASSWCGEMDNHGGVVVAITVSVDRWYGSGFLRLNATSRAFR